jgi:membrane fusion protein, copper/silver efflux system
MKKTLITLFCGVVIGLAISYWLMENPLKKTPAPTRKILYWVAPMDKNYRRDKPGKSPMGMDLVPVYAAQEIKKDDNIIKINPAVVDNLGVITTPAIRKSLSRIINAVGNISVDEEKIEHINSYTDGWVRDLMIKAVGDKVTKGQKLFSLYSPTLVNAQQELVLALKNNNKRLIAPSIKKLKTLGLTTSQIQNLIKTRNVQKNIPIFANNSGIVESLNIRDGIYIKPEKDLMVIQDLSSIWIVVDVFAKSASWLAPNQIALATVEGIPNMTWQGHIIYVYPELNRKTHTLPVRIKFPNPNNQLKPGMFAQVKIFAKNTPPQLVIPSNAIIKTGQGNHVIIALGEGRFKPQAITTGIESDNLTAVIQGLKLGDNVVIQSQFLIDSESNIDEALMRLNSKKSKKITPSGKREENEPISATVIAINKKNRTITLIHQTTATMPNMMMQLEVANTVDLKAIKTGQTIRVVFKKISPHHYIIEKIYD